MRSKNSPTGRQSFIERARREQIIEAGILTIADVGYGHASLARIAERAGISKSVISYHFDDKDELIELVVEKIYGDSWLATKPRLDAEPSAAGQLRAFIEAEIAYYVTHRERLLAIGSIVVNHRAPDGSLRYPPGAEASVVRVLVGLLRAGQDSGELGNFDPLPIAVTVSYAITGALEQWVLDPAIDLTAYCAQLVQMFDCAIRAQPGVAA
jgi:AcrR family transcriptional regulator